MENCLHCGREIQWSNNKKKYCGPKCSKAYNTAKLREKKGIVERTVTCAHCGEVFTTWSMQKVYCGWECNNAAQTERKKKLVEEKRNAECI
jgi:hypothetical protein